MRQSAKMNWRTTGATGAAIKAVAPVRQCASPFRDGATGAAHYGLRGSELGAPDWRTNWRKRPALVSPRPRPLVYVVTPRPIWRADDG